MAPTHRDKYCDKHVREPTDIKDRFGLSEDEYSALLPSLKIVEKIRPLSQNRCKFFVERIKIVAMGYNGRQFLAAHARDATLHQIAAPITQVIKILEQEANIDAILTAIGGPSMNPKSLRQAVRKYKNMLRSLRQIKEQVPPTLQKSRGRVKADDLHIAVEWLADCWERLTEREYTRYWQKNRPVTDAMIFTCSVVGLIAPERLPELPTVTKNVVAARRKRLKAAWPDPFWGSMPNIKRKSLPLAKRKRGTFR